MRLVKPSPAGLHAPANDPWQAVCRALLIGLLCLLGLVAGTARAADAPAGATPATTGLSNARDYVIGPGDVLRINVYQNTDLTLETRVSESGTISYPLLGSVKLGGLSIAQAERTIAEGLLKGNYLRNPQVNVMLMQVRGNQASVLGMVNRPGRYPIEVTGLRMSELLATAGGVAPGGSDIVTLTGMRSGKQVRYSLDIGKLLTSGTLDQDPVILNGDTLYVDRMPLVYIYGQVQRPGSVRLERGMTVMQALASGGGLTLRGTEKNIKVNRRNADGKVKEYDAALTDPLVDGDVIFVRESLF
jgi:polysaccharide export outer membrane protein